MTQATTWNRVVAAAARLVDSTRFQALVVAVIVANAVVIGVETYDHDAGTRELLDGLDTGFLAFFVAEILLRVTAHGWRLDRFLRSGWNVFDLAIVAAAFVPGISQNATLLRIARVLRVARLISVIPDLRVIVRGLGRSLAPMAGVAVLTLVIMYVYAIVGWTLFGDELPARWGTAGEAMLTMFELLTLEGWNEIFREARGASDWAIPYFVSFILLGTFVVLNIVIAVVINSVEEARRVEVAGRQATSDAVATPVERVARLREALDELERDLLIAGGYADGGRPPDPPGA